MKPTKADMTGAIMLHADNDPNEGETIEAAKARIMSAYDAHDPPPSIVIDSGNGLQGIWLLDKEHVFPAMVSTTPKSKEFEAEAQARAAPVEDRNRALATATGAPAGTHNVDRLLRLPGTINYPNAAKILKGRSVCQSSIVRLTDARYPLERFPAIERRPKQGQEGEETRRATTRTKATTRSRRRSRTGSASALWRRQVAGPVRGALPLDQARVLPEENRRDGARYSGRHRGAHRCAGRRPGDDDRTADRARRAEDRLRHRPQDGAAGAKSIKNIRIALAKMGVTLRYDQFALQDEIEGLKGFGPSMDDAAINRLWVEMDQRFGSGRRWRRLLTVANDTAQTNRHHPVKDYLAGLKWDGVPRVDTWLINYGGAEDTKYVRAVSACRCWRR